MLLLNNIVLLIFFTHIVLALFLLGVSSKYQLSNRLLAVFLLLIAFDLSNFIFPGFYQTYLNFDMFRANSGLLTPAVLYLYIRSMVYSDFKLKKRDLWHTLPFLVILLLFTPRFFGVDVDAKLVFYQHMHSMIEIMLSVITVHIQWAVYLTLGFMVLLKHQKVLRDNYSQAEQVNNRWLVRFLQLYTVNFLIILLRNALKFVGSESTIEMLTTVMLLVTLSFSCWLLFQVLRKPQLFQRVDSKIEPVQSVTNTTKQKQKLQDKWDQSYGEPQQLVDHLHTHMRLSRPFLNNSLTMQNLAEQLKLPETQLSILINHYIGQHFFDLVNEYRINAAAEILRDPNQRSKTILEIIYEVGFNSKSSFNTAFKKQIKLTPSQYRQSCQS